MIILLIYRRLFGIYSNNLSQSPHPISFDWFKEIDEAIHGASRLFFIHLVVDCCQQLKCSIFLAASYGEEQGEGVFQHSFRFALGFNIVHFTRWNPRRTAYYADHGFGYQRSIYSG